MHISISFFIVRYIETLLGVKNFWMKKKHSVEVKGSVYKLFVDICLQCYIPPFLLSHFILTTVQVR